MGLWVMVPGLTHNGDYGFHFRLHWLHLTLEEVWLLYNELNFFQFNSLHCIWSTCVITVGKNVDMFACIDKNQKKKKNVFT